MLKIAQLDNNKFRFRIETDNISYSNFDPERHLKDIIEWCEDNIIGTWSFRTIISEISHYPKGSKTKISYETNIFFEFEFELENDAALFKLHF